MSTATDPRNAVEPVMRQARDLRCPKCDRFIGKAAVPSVVQAGDAWLRLYCRSCRDYVMVDAVTSRKHDGRGGVVQ